MKPRVGPSVEPRDVVITPDWAGRIDTITQLGTTIVDYNFIGSRVASREYPDTGLSPDIIEEMWYQANQSSQRGTPLWFVIPPLKTQVN